MYGSSRANRLAYVRYRTYNTKQDQQDDRMLRNLNIESLAAAYATARARLERHVAELARSRGMEVTVELELDIRPGVHRITLRCGQKEIVVSVADDLFMDPDEFFVVYVLPRIKVAIGKLAAMN